MVMRLKDSSTVSRKSDSGVSTSGSVNGDASRPNSGSVSDGSQESNVQHADHTVNGCDLTYAGQLL